jgi:hypothetical protein
MCKGLYKIRLRGKKFLAPNSSLFSQAILVANIRVYLAEGQFSVKQIWHKAESVTYCAGTRRPTISKEKVRIDTKVKKK